MSDNIIIQKAISELLGQVSIGDVVAHPTDKMAYNLTDVVNGQAICTYHGIKKVWPVSEIFDCNKVKRRCLELVYFSDRLN